ncbi:Ada metal-binding domain-containing protein [Mucilaginibacter straminoryzae]
MIRHSELGPPSFSTSKKLYRFIKSNEINFAGYLPGKIYGRLTCASGKQMKHMNRVFFKDVTEAEANGYRPCRNCMYKEYQEWKNRQKL